MSVAVTLPPRCEHCRHRRNDPRVTEQLIPGLTSFGSAYGASIAASALCEVHDCFVSPLDTCRRFTPRDGEASAAPCRAADAAQSSLASDDSTSPSSISTSSVVLPLASSLSNW